LITVDTVRADRLGSYGYSLSTTPNLDRFAEETTMFANCISTAPHTNPAIASIMTSQYPSFHSVGPKGNARPMQLDESTLARVLSENGYLTAAFVGNFTRRRRLRFYGGFTTYDDTYTSAEITRNVAERTAEGTNEYALNWLKTAPNRSFFLWVHYQDPHGPYTPPERYLGQFPEDAYSVGAEALSVTNNDGKGGIPEYQYYDGQTSPVYYQSRYDAEIAYADEFIGRLLDNVKELGLWDKTIIVFTTDHGEAMGEHEYYFCHGHALMNELIHVPLIIHIPGVEQIGKVDEVVSLVDIAPTIVDAAGIAQGMDGKGLSLMPLIRGKTQRLDREYVVAEDGHGRVCFRSRKLKYVSGPDGDGLFDLVTRGDESENILEKEPELAGAFGEMRDAYRASAKPQAEGDLRQDSTEIERLKALGYIN